MLSRQRFLHEGGHSQKLARQEGSLRPIKKSTVIELEDVSDDAGVPAGRS
jgi:hypothetical protein